MTRRFLGLSARAQARLPSYQPLVVEREGFMARHSSKLWPHKKNRPDRHTYTMIFPPPNVTGTLHLGHALTVSVQDAIIRHRHMKGFNVKWIPGTDHAGIATQSVVERLLLQREKLTRYDLGREKFVERIWQWKGKHGLRIAEQMKRLGGAWDWDNEFFSMDETRSKSVTNAFVQLFDDGLIYRDNRMVNWCCTLQTVISDIEVDYAEVQKPTKLQLPGGRLVEVGVMHKFAYPVLDETGVELGELVVATTRLETMVGDTAVAIHPSDPRYTRYHGKKVRHPLTGELLPIVCDEKLVDLSVGTGAVKITPAHDPNDFECAKRHKLPLTTIFDDQGRLNDVCGVEELVGMDRYEARKRIVELLDRCNAFRGKEPHSMRIGICSRSGDIVEPMIKPQWYLRCGDMARRVLEDTEQGKYEIKPSYMKNQWFRWLEGTQDWCLSRQLWWGHRVPIYLVHHPSLKRQVFVAALNFAEAETKARRLLETDSIGDLDKMTLVQDPDVLDTWFSAALLPLSALGWEGTGPIPSRYPTDAIESGTDILFFWIARMAMICSHFGGQAPFKSILLHAMVNDSEGKKMSKSKGNVIDPMDIIEGTTLEEMKQRLRNSNLIPAELKKGLKSLEKQFPSGIEATGADAVRYTLIEVTRNRQINIDINRFQTARHFGNKIWNIVNFAEMTVAKYDSEFVFDPENLTPPNSVWNQFILSRLTECVKRTELSFEQNRLADASIAISDFIQTDLADTYLEFIKPVLQKDASLAQECLGTLYFCLDSSIRLLHPFMPYLTEELYQSLKPRMSNSQDSITQTAYPETGPLCFQEAEAEMALYTGTVHACRSLKDRFDLRSKNVPFVIISSDANTKGCISKSLDILQKLVRSDAILVQDGTGSSFDGPLVNVDAKLKVGLPQEALRYSDNHEAFVRNNAKKLQQVEKNLSRLEAEITSKKFLECASPEIQEIRKQRYESLKITRDQLVENLCWMQTS